MAAVMHSYNCTQSQLTQRHLHGRKVQREPGLKCQKCVMYCAEVRGVLSLKCVPGRLCTSAVESETTGNRKRCLIYSTFMCYVSVFPRTERYDGKKLLSW